MQGSREFYCDGPQLVYSMPLVGRRAIIRGAVSLLGVGGLAGCLGSGEDGSEPPPAATPTSELDFREANVVDVEIDGDGSNYTFAVTLHHDDNGEAGYANWWQVERLDGTKLGRRELLHAHGEQPFTRSTTIEIPASVDCVVVRGHDQTHEYGGRAVVVDLEAAAVRGVNQGPERQRIDEAICP